jgi:hypothetical protein
MSYIEKMALLLSIQMDAKSGIGIMSYIEKMVLLLSTQMACNLGG